MDFLLTNDFINGQQEKHDKEAKAKKKWAAHQGNFGKDFVQQSMKSFATNHSPIDKHFKNVIDEAIMKHVIIENQALELME